MDGAERREAQRVFQVASPDVSDQAGAALELHDKLNDPEILRRIYREVPEAEDRSPAGQTAASAAYGAQTSMAKLANMDWRLAAFRGMLDDAIKNRTLPRQAREAFNLIRDGLYSATDKQSNLEGVRRRNAFDAMFKKIPESWGMNLNADLARKMGPGELPMPIGKDLKVSDYYDWKNAIHDWHQDLITRYNKEARRLKLSEINPFLNEFHTPGATRHARFTSALENTVKNVWSHGVLGKEPGYGGLFGSEADKAAMQKGIYEYLTSNSKIGPDRKIQWEPGSRRSYLDHADFETYRNPKSGDKPLGYEAQAERYGVKTAARIEADRLSDYILNDRSRLTNREQGWSPYERIMPWLGERAHTLSKTEVANYLSRLQYAVEGLEGHHSGLESSFKALHSMIQASLDNPRVQGNRARSSLLQGMNEILGHQLPKEGTLKGDMFTQRGQVAPEVGKPDELENRVLKVIQDLKGYSYNTMLLTNPETANMHIVQPFLTGLANYGPGYLLKYGGERFLNTWMVRNAMLGLKVLGANVNPREIVKNPMHSGPGASIKILPHALDENAGPILRAQAERLKKIMAADRKNGGWDAHAADFRDHLWNKYDQERIREAIRTNNPKIAGNLPYRFMNLELSGNQGSENPTSKPSFYKGFTGKLIGMYKSMPVGNAARTIGMNAMKYGGTTPKNILHTLYRAGVLGLRGPVDVFMKANPAIGAAILGAGGGGSAMVPAALIALYAMMAHDSKKESDKRQALNTMMDPVMNFNPDKPLTSAMRLGAMGLGVMGSSMLPGAGLGNIRTAILSGRSPQDKKLGSQMEPTMKDDEGMQGIANMVGDISPALGTPISHAMFLADLLTGKGTTTTGERAWYPKEAANRFFSEENPLPFVNQALAPVAPGFYPRFAVQRMPDYMAPTAGEANFERMKEKAIRIKMPGIVSGFEK